VAKQKCEHAGWGQRSLSRNGGEAGKAGEKEAAAAADDTAAVAAAGRGAENRKDSGKGIL